MMYACRQSPCPPSQWTVALHVDRILESSSRPPSSRAFWLDTVKSTRVVARPTSLCHQLPSRLAAEALFLGWWGWGDIAECAVPSRAPVGCDGARDGILQIARFRFCLIDLIGGQGGIESTQIPIGGTCCVH